VCCELTARGGRGPPGLSEGWVRKWVDGRDTQHYASGRREGEAGGKIAIGRTTATPCWRP